jgi:hypothetical protein
VKVEEKIDGEDHMNGGRGQPVKGSGGLARLRVTEARSRLERLERQSCPEPATRMARAELAAAVAAALALGLEIPSWQMPGEREQEQERAAVPEQRTAPVGGGRCWGTKRDGTRCGFMASAGSTLCGAHTHRARAERP